MCVCVCVCDREREREREREKQAVKLLAIYTPLTENLTGGRDPVNNR